VYSTWFLPPKEKAPATEWLQRLIEIAGKRN
jgi:hypothetical protein